MKLKIFAVRDRAIDHFMNPLFVHSTGQAIRDFADAVNNTESNNNLNKHAEDFDLYELGDFDTSSGKFETGQPKQVAVGKDVRVNKPQQ